MMGYKEFTDKEKIAFNDIERIIIKLKQKEINKVIKLIMWKWFK